MTQSISCIERGVSEGEERGLVELKRKWLRH